MLIVKRDEGGWEGVILGAKKKLAALKEGENDYTHGVLSLNCTD